MKVKVKKRVLLFKKIQLNHLLLTHLMWVYLIQVVLKLYVEKHWFNIIYNHSQMNISILKL